MGMLVAQYQYDPADKVIAMEQFVLRLPVRRNVLSCLLACLNPCCPIVLIALHGEDGLSRDPIQGKGRSKFV